MADALLAIVQKACGRIAGLAAPSSVIGNPDVITGTMLALAIEEGDELMRAHDWSALTIEGATLTLTAGQESYPLPPDFDRLVAGTAWDRSVRWPMRGPDTAMVARARRESIVQDTPFRRSFRQSGSNLLIWPVPVTTGDVIAFDYMSNLWAASSTGTGQTTFLADSDVPVLPSHLFILGVKWRWLEIQGMAADVTQAQYAADVRRAIARDTGGGRIVDVCGARLWDEPGNAGDVFAAPVVSLTIDPTAGT